jgi:hypothetical protein
MRRRLCGDSRIAASSPRRGKPASDEEVEAADAEAAGSGTASDEEVEAADAEAAGSGTASETADTGSR